MCGLNTWQIHLDDAILHYDIFQYELITIILECKTNIYIYIYIVLHIIYLCCACKMIPKGFPFIFWLLSIRSIVFSPPKHECRDVLTKCDKGCNALPPLIAREQKPDTHEAQHLAYLIPDWRVL